MASSKSKLTSSQPIQIPAIPPFKRRDNQHSNYPPHPNSSQSPQASITTFTASVSPPKVIADIPPYKPRQSKDLTPDGHHQASSSSSSSQHRESQDYQVPEHQITIGPTGGAEWMKRLKVAEQSPIHRSTDCIASKDLGTSSDSELLKPAPSWSNVALKSTEQASTSECHLKLIEVFAIFTFLNQARVHRQFRKPQRARRSRERRRLQRKSRD
jgi:anoctamin-8